MTLTRTEAELIAEEARQQGWEGDRHMVQLDNGEEYNEGYGRIDVYDWDKINRERERLGNESLGGSGCSVELTFPTVFNVTYHVTERDDWRKLKAKVDEIAEILRQATERGWQVTGHPQKVGRFGMMVEVVPRGGSRAYPVRVGGMRTWRKLCREYDDMIEVTEQSVCRECGAAEGDCHSQSCPTWPRQRVKSHQCEPGHANA